MRYKDNRCGDRIFEVDAVKFFAIFYMICEHVYERFGSFDLTGTLPDTVYRNIVEFCGGPLSAPVFMFCMGIGMICTRHDSPSDHIRRGIKLLITGYLLNLFRQTVPMLIAMALDIDTGFSLIGGLLNVDILPFAGMAFIAVGVMKKMKLKLSVMFIVSLLLQAAGIWAVKLKIRSVAVATFIGLLIPGGDHVAFPMSLWLIYPVSGMIFGRYLKQAEDGEKMYRKLTAFSAVFFVSYSAALIFAGYDLRLIYSLYNSCYYNQTLLSFLWIVPLVVLSICIAHYLLNGIRQSVIGRFIVFCSMNLTMIYIIQWLLIGYGLGFYILLGFGPADSPAGLITGAFVLMAVSVAIMTVIRKAGDKRLLKLSK